ncbi:MAG: hypothetical protein JSW25_09220, partial [Thermoplasmata archaeon]
GTASEPTQVLSFSGEDLAHAEMSNVVWANNNLTYRPKNLFTEQFNGPLNPAKWTIVRDHENVSVENGVLKLDFLWAWPAPESNGTLVKSTEFEIPEGVDYQAEYRMKTSSYGYSGAGGGISDGAVSAWESHLATLGYWTGGVPFTWMRVIAGGDVYYNSTGYDWDWHDYTMTYDVRTDTYRCARDAEDLGGYTMDTVPSMFWFGHTEDEGMYDSRPVIEVDHVNVWATSGEWLSDVVDVGHHISLDGAGLDWDSSSKKDADVLFEVRASDDEENWTDWVAFDGDTGALEAPLNGTYFQLRMRLAMPGILREQAFITVTGFSLRYRDPLVTVEVRTQDTDWMPTEGTHEWSADLMLAEDSNTISVRAIDTSGAENVTSFEMIVDTTPPVGTMSIAGDDAYTNDLNVTLLLDATDKYGVEWVDISHFPDFSRKVRLPYSDQADWRMSSVEGETYVFVRFIDSHGLVSSVVSDSIFYDSFPPMASVVIDGDAEYTSGRAVQLALEYSDNIQVALVELANDQGFTDPFEVADGTTTVDWQLAEGGDGPRTVYLRVTDIAGNVVTDSDGIELYEPKSVGSVVIDDGAPLTGTTLVTLTIDVPLISGARLMQISNDPTFAGADWTVVEEEIWWYLEEGDGERTVYMRIIDFRDIESIPVSDTILLDQTAPDLTVTLDGGAAYTTDVTVSGAVVYEDANEPVQMWVSMDDTFEGVRPTDFTEAFEHVIPARESDHRIYVRVEDEAGNLGIASAVIHYATIRPHIVLELPQGNVVQLTDVVQVQVTPTDPYGDIHLQVGFDDRPDEDSEWIPLNGVVRVPVPDGTRDGAHTIWVRARNAAGLTSEQPVSIGLTFDTVAPALSILNPLDGSKLFRKHREVILEVDVSDTSKLDSLVYTVDGGDPQNLSKYRPTVNVTLDAWGEHTIRVTAADVAGNVATSTTVFKVQDSDDLRTGGGTGLLLIILMAIVGAAIVVGITYNRLYMPGLRRTSIHDGDGWHEDWDHPEMEDCDDEKRPCDLPVSDKDPVYMAREEAKNGKTPEVEEIAGTELEAVELPEELKKGDDDWSEF